MALLYFTMIGSISLDKILPKFLCSGPASLLRCRPLVGVSDIFCHYLFLRCLRSANKPPMKGTPPPDPGIYSKGGAGFDAEPMEK